MIPSDSRFQKYAPEVRNPGEEALPYVKSSRKGRILAFVALLHGGILLLPLLFMIVKERTRKVPLYVMHVPVVESVPGSPSAHPSPHREKAQGIPDRGFPPEDLPELPKIEKAKGCKKKGIENIIFLSTLISFALFLRKRR